MPNSAPAQDNIIYQEMMSHPILFSHLCPQKIAIIGDDNHGILAEAAKHENIADIWFSTKKSDQKHVDPRVRNFTEEPHSLPHQFFDILIVDKALSVQYFSAYFNALNFDGMLVQVSECPFQMTALKSARQNILTAGFADTQILQFPRPQFLSGWCAAIMAKKHGVFNRVREKDIFNKSFNTHYYNFDTHKAGLAIPEFMRQELTV